MPDDTSSAVSTDTENPKETLGTQLDQGGTAEDSISTLKALVNILTKNNVEKDRLIAYRDHQISLQQTVIGQKDDEIIGKDQDNAVFQTGLHERSRVVKNLKKEVEKLTKESQDKTRMIDDRDHRLQVQQTIIGQKEVESAKKDRLNAELEKRLIQSTIREEKCKKQIQALTEKNKKKDGIIVKLGKLLKTSREKVAEMQEKLDNVTGASKILGKK